jgi:succinate-semialdehyde dehydrogenase/glutarate-semialdehyde dehydrogenase
MSVDVINPWTGRIERRYDYMSPSAVDAVLAASRRGFADWSARTLDERALGLRRIAELLVARRAELSALMTAEMGKRRVEGEAEIDKCVGVCRFYAERAGEYLSTEPVATASGTGLIRYEPLGVVLAIMPWNFPVWQVFRFLAPLLAAGNVALLKHAVTVPGCADAIARLVRDAGLPEGALGVLHIDNDMAAKVIADPRVQAVSLTGSERAGRSVAATAGAHLKKCVLELGGSDPFIVLEDADLEAAVKVAIASRYDNAGQTCIAAKRFVLVEPIAREFTERFLAEAARLEVSDPADESCSLAPMARADLRDGLHGQVMRSVAAGARLLLGGNHDQHPCAYPATVLADIARGTVAYCEELFGPVASLFTVADEAAALALANDSVFGLGASIWSRDTERALSLAARIEAGCVFINGRVRSDFPLPFGGIKRSGFGRELGAHGVREFTNIKSVLVE